MHPRIVLLSLFVSSFCPVLAAATTVSTFEDITFWIGSGEHRAALVVDWNSSTDTDEALVWGFRWSDTATGEDMLRAVIEADNRLYAKLGAAGSFGVPIYGLGYDLDDDGEFGISDGSEFDELGITEAGVPDPPPQTIVAASVDAADLYAEGFFTGSFNYALGQGNPFAGGSWGSSPSGASSRMLTDGDWDSWAFESPVELMSSAFAENPVAAELPFTDDFDADFDRDDDIDGTDLLAWQRGFGISENATLAQGDANRDGRVDSLDLDIWQQSYSTIVIPIAIKTATVPEPSTLILQLLFLSFVLKGRRVS